jgi:nucleoside-diphosphate-sugar epimerase
LDESAPFKPTNPYAASKAAADAICIAYFESYGMDIKIVRLFNPYGPYQQLNKIIPTLYKQAIQGNDLSVYGDGRDTRDYVYISDIVSGLWQARQLPPGEIINLATGKVTTNYEIAKIILEITQSRSEITFVPYPKEFGNIKNQVGSYQKAKKLVDWSPKIPLKQGIIKTIEWLKNFNKGG